MYKRTHTNFEMFFGHEHAVNKHDASTKPNKSFIPSNTFDPLDGTHLYFSREDFFMRKNVRCFFFSKVFKKCC